MQTSFSSQLARVLCRFILKIGETRAEGRITNSSAAVSVQLEVIDLMTCTGLSACLLSLDETSIGYKAPSGQPVCLRHVLRSFARTSYVKHIGVVGERITTVDSPLFFSARFYPSIGVEQNN